MSVNQNTSNGTYCPPTMVRFENTNFGTVWACRMCSTLILAERSVAPHIAACMKENEFTPPTKKDEEIKYACKVCNKIFSRHVKLKKHEEEHFKSSSDSDFIESDDELPKKKPKNEEDDEYRVEDDEDEDDV